jgi:hypothetical protein
VVEPRGSATERHFVGRRRRFADESLLRSAHRYAAICTLVLLLSGCSSDAGANSGRADLPWFDPAPLPWHAFYASGPVRFASSVSWDANEQRPLRAFLSIHNPSDSVVNVSTGVCGFGLRAYVVAPPTGDPVWDDRPPSPTQPNTAYACPDLEVSFTVPPGGSERIAVHDYGLGSLASLPDPGRYIFAIVLKDGDGVVYLVPSDSVVVPPR